MRHLLVFFIILAPLFAHAQDVFLSGTIRDKSGQPLDAVTVTIIDDEKNVLAYTLTNSAGNFALSLKGQKDQSSLSMVVTSIGYRKTTIPLKEEKFPLVLDIEEEPFTIAEVTVKASGIWESGDTLSYGVLKFKQAQDRSVADVLKRMPGIEVSENGTIQYQGKNISTVYVEGLDLTGGNYTQVTNNLNADKISSVQVLENHQKMKAFKDIEFSDQAALNLKLKDSAKEVAQWLVDLGIGHSAQEKSNKLSGSARIVQMRFRKRFQQFNIYRNDYTGKDITQDMGNVSEDNSGIEKTLLSPITSSVSGINGRYEDNSAHLLSSNSLWKRGEDDVLLLSASAYTDITKVNQTAYTVYKIDSIPLVLAEDNNTHDRHSELRADLQYTSNKTNLLLDNTLSLYGDFDHDRALTSANGKALRQDVRPQQFFIKDRFQTMKAGETGKWGLEGFLAFNHLPGKLLLIDGSSQRICQDALNGYLALTLVKACGHLNSVWKFGAGGQLSLLSQARDDLPSTTDSYLSLRCFASYGLTYSNAKVKASLTLPVSLLSRSYCDSIKSTDLFTYPTAYFDWSIRSSWRMTVSAQYACTPNSTENLWRSIIYRDYMNATEGNAGLSLEEGFRAAVAIQHKNVLEGLFCNLRLSFVSRYNLPLYDRSMLNNGMLLSRIISRSGKNTALGVNGGISKVFGHFTVAVNGAASVGKSTVIFNGVNMPCKNRGASGNISLSWSPLKWLSLESQPFCAVQSRDVDNSQYGSFFFGSSNKLYIPVSKFIVHAAIDYFECTKPEKSEAFFVDASVSYKTKTIEYIIGARNIFGAKSFSRTEISDYYEKTTVTKLRPREVFCDVVLNF